MLSNDTKHKDKYSLTELDAYKEVAAYKWVSGFVCPKCGYTKYSEGDTPYSRRCLRTGCKITASVKANTIFSGLRLNLICALELIKIVLEIDFRISIVDAVKLINERTGIVPDKTAVFSFLNKIYASMKREIPYFDKDVTVFTFLHRNERIMGTIGYEKGILKYYSCTTLKTGNKKLYNFIDEHISEKAAVATFDFNMYQFKKRGVITIPLENRKKYSIDFQQAYDEISIMKKYFSGVSSYSLDIALYYYVFRRNNYSYEDFMKKAATEAVK